MSGKDTMKTRKEWAHAFGVDYAVMQQALRRDVQGRRLPNHLFDEDTARDALVKYYADRRMIYLRKAQQLETVMNYITNKQV